MINARRLSAPRDIEREWLEAVATTRAYQLVGSRAYRIAVLEAHQAGVRIRDIAQAAGVSTQAIYVLIAKEAQR